MSQTINEPVLLLKSCIGNRALGWDLLPPGSEGYEFTDTEGVTWVHPGYGGSPRALAKRHCSREGKYLARRYTIRRRHCKSQTSIE